MYKKANGSIACLVLMALYPILATLCLVALYMIQKKQGVVVFLYLGHSVLFENTNIHALSTPLNFRYFIKKTSGHFHGYSPPCKPRSACVGGIYHQTTNSLRDSWH